MGLHQSEPHAGKGIVPQGQERSAVPLAGERQRVRPVRPRDRGEEQCRIRDRARERPVGIEVGPGRDHPGAGDEAEGRLHPDDSGELRRDAVGAAVVGAESREGHSGRDRDRRAGAGSSRCPGAGRIVRIQHLAGVAAGAVAVVGEVVGGSLPEDDGTRRTESRHLERVAAQRLREKARPIGVGTGSRQPPHVVDRLGEDRDAVERPVHRAGAQAGVGCARLVQGRGRQDVDRAPSHPLGATAFERPGRDLDGGPLAAPAAGLIVGDGAVERVLVGPDPATKREDGDGGELGQDFASSGRHYQG